MLRFNKDEGRLYNRLALKVPQVDTYTAFLEMYEEELRALIPFETAICGIGHITAQSTVQAQKLIIVDDFPLEYLHTLAGPDGTFNSPKMVAWMDKQEPQLYADTPYYNQQESPEWIETLRRYGFRNMACHGMHDIRGNCASYFSFCNIKGGMRRRYGELLTVLVPLLHSMLLRIMDQAPLGGIENFISQKRFSDLEVGYLKMIQEGKNKKMMAAELRRSENTVRNQLHRIYRKLGTSNRVEALEQARLLGLI